VALDLFSKLHQKSTLLFLQTYPTPQVAQLATTSQIEDLLRQSRHPHASEAAAKLVEHLRQPQLQADAVTIRAKSRLMLALVNQLLPLLEQIAQYDKEVSTLFLKHPDHELWRSLPRAAKRLAPRLLAEWGDDRARYEDASSVQALAGTAPVPFQSGTFAKAHKRFACLKPLRNVLYQLAWQTTRSEPWAATYYQRKRTEGKSHSMAVRSLANVWVRIIFRLWQDETAYQTSIFETAQKAHAKRVA
jgi:Transposase IS116/IS110/IS902 family